MKTTAVCGPRSGWATPSLREARKRQRTTEPAGDPLIRRRTLSERSRPPLSWPAGRYVAVTWHRPRHRAGAPPPALEAGRRSTAVPRTRHSQEACAPVRPRPRREPSLRLGYALPARGPQTATHDGTGRRSTYPTPNFVRTIPATAVVACRTLRGSDLASTETPSRRTTASS